ncbi:MAG: cobalamin 5'-phosphate synthase [Candidatus Firestonebacteria bacterium RIFOXYC2_FULL_39_67]|nr:MAG: cobalamin 5'-phosphate synthase [Candidatus Firestonebacteria bacterium RIFOXYD2_FULL_39_29]OGF56803.1 MAG: cobalamin 5'-phosphate synthase [Candidatus Firestonebacteria bacterium RIFOXYC2_FULL_39_67]
MKSFLIALQFLTNIPFKIKNIKQNELPGSVTYYPLVGLIIGALLALSYFVFSKIFVFLLPSVLVIGVYLLLTGALHLDGFTDTVDGLYGGRTKKDIFRIMEDSATGAKGAAWAAFILLLKVIIIIKLSFYNVYPALLLFPVLGRYSMTILMKYSPYAKKYGMGKVYCQNITNTQFIIITAFALLLSVFFGLRGLVAFVCAAAAALIIMKYFKNKLGGVTGDIFGFTVEVTEVAALLIFAIKLKY